jgi:hypothetical protein
MATVEFAFEILIFLLAAMFVYEASFLWDVMLWHWWMVSDNSPKHLEPLTPQHCITEDLTSTKPL